MTHPIKQSFTALALALTLSVAQPARAQLLAPAGAAPAPAAAGDQNLDRIVAVVDDGVILQSELNDAVRTVQQQYASNPGQLPPSDVLNRQVLDRLILMRLQVNKAGEQGIEVSNADIDRAVAGVAQQNKMTPDQLRGAVQQSGASFAAFRDQLSQQLTVQKLHESVVRNQVQVTDTEINNLLTSPTYKAGEIHLSHIEVGVPAGASAADIQSAQNKATEARKAVDGGMDFNAAAIRYSDGQDALDGGDLGWRRMDDIPPAFVEAVRAMKPGDVSPILRGPTGFQILKLVGERQPQKQVVTEYHARQILIKPSELLTDAQAQQKAEDLYKRIVDKKEDFAKLAKEFSKDDTTANAGGDMNWFPADAWGSAVAQQVNTLKPNEVSQPFKTEAGWDIMQLLGTRQTDRTEDIERDQARQAIGNRKSEQAYEDFLRQLRSSAYVNILVPTLRDPADKSADAQNS